MFAQGLKAEDVRSAGLDAACFSGIMKNATPAAISIATTA
jgi:hypothetical protein